MGGWGEAGGGNGGGMGWGGGWGDGGWEGGGGRGNPPRLKHFWLYLCWHKHSEPVWPSGKVLGW